MPRDEATLLDIVHAAELARIFVEGMDKDAFMDDSKTQSAVTYQLTVVGEATKRLSDEFRDQHPEVPWRLMDGMRDQLIHEYDIVDLDEVWKAVDRDIPDLLEKLEPLLPPKKRDKEI
ncbi:MAG: DUF86 domain-containing protein [Chloroflexota bacterium]